MPIYEFRCPKCSTVHERVCRIAYRNEPFHCDRCRTVLCERIITVPHAAAWNDQEIFPNLDKIADLGGIPGGKRFPSRASYDKYLKDNGVCEIGGAHVDPGRPKIFHYGKKDTQPVPPRGAW